MRDIALTIAFAIGMATVASGQAPSSVAAPGLPLLVRGASVSIGPIKTVSGVHQTEQKILQSFVRMVPVNEAGGILPETAQRTLTITQETGHWFELSKVRFENTKGEAVTEATAIESIKKHRAFLLHQNQSEKNISNLELFNEELVCIVPPPIERTRRKNTNN